MAAVDERLAPVLNAMSPDLERFLERGGRMLHYHGLADPVVPAQDSISYHERVVAHRARQRPGDGGGPADLERARHDTARFYRLFLVPGMEHCRGGPGPSSFDALPALVRWVEEGVAPDRIVAARLQGEGAARRPAFTRPLCPFPQRARHRGQGDPTDAASFECVAEGWPRDLPEPAPEYLR